MRFLKCYQTENIENKRVSIGQCHSGIEFIIEKQMIHSTFKNGLAQISSIVFITYTTRQNSIYALIERVTKLHCILKNYKI